jgi:uncharacterized membrane protein YfcA
MPGFEFLSLPLVLWVALVLAFAGLVQGALGLGFPMVATPLIAVFTDMRTAVILVLLPCVATTVTNVVRSGPIVATLRRFWFMPILMLAGASAGAWLFVRYPAFPYALLLASVILLYLYLDKHGHAQWPAVARHPVLFGMLFAFIAGASEGSANVAAPPLLMYLFSLGVERHVMVQILNVCFTVGKPTQWLILTAEGGVSTLQWAMTLPFAALATITTLAGIRIRDAIDSATYRRWLLRVLLIIALVLIAQFAWQAAR